jgi:hypothetical protein
MVRPLLAGAFAAAGLVVLVIGCGSGTEAQTNSTGSTPSTSSTGGTTDPGTTTPTVAVDFDKDVKPVVENYCTPCHTGPDPKGGIDVTKLTSSDSATFAKMARMVDGGKMPPRNGKPLPADVKTKLVSDLKSLSG